MMMLSLKAQGLGLVRCCSINPTNPNEDDSTKSRSSGHSIPFPIKPSYYQHVRFKWSPKKDDFTSVEFSHTTVFTHPLTPTTDASKNKKEGLGDKIESQLVKVLFSESIFRKGFIVMLILILGFGSFCFVLDLGGKIRANYALIMKIYNTLLKQGM